MAERCICCLRRRYGALDQNSNRHRLLDPPGVQLDTSRMGHGVVIVKNGKRICGTGAALANAPIVQDKAYFEAKLQSSGIWGLGLATKNCNLQKVPLGYDVNSWVLRHDGALCHNDAEIGHLDELPQEGDIIGVTYDHVDLHFYVNGHVVQTYFSGIKGTVLPVVYVDEGAILDMQFNHFYNEPPNGFEQIMIEKSLL